MGRRKDDSGAPAPRRLRRRLLMLAGGLLVLLAAAPTIVGNSPLLGLVLARAVPLEDTKVSARRAAGGWISPLRLEGVTVTDAAGEAVFEAAEVRVDKNLLELAGGHRRLKLLVDRPVLRVRVRPGGSNVEDLLSEAQEALGDEGPADGGESDTGLVAIAVRDATLYVADEASGARWTHQGLTLNADLSDGLRTLRVEGLIGGAQQDFAQILENPNPNVRIALDESDAPARRVRLEVRSAPVDALTPLVSRRDATARLSGVASVRGEVVWTPRGAPQHAPLAERLLAAGFTSEGQMTLQRFTARGAALRGDVLRLERVEAPWVLHADGRRLIVEQLQVKCDVGAVRAQGALAPRELRRLACGDWPLSSDGEWPEGRVQAHVDLAELARLVPGALALRSDAQPLSGRLSARLESTPEGGGRMTAQITASDFAADVAGRRVSWQAPLTVTGDVGRIDGRLVVHALTCQSDFLEGEAQGDLSSLRADARFDLDRLAEQLGQVVDLGQWRLAGRGGAQVRVESKAPGRVRATVVGNLANVTVAQGASEYLREPHLSASLSADVAVDAPTLAPQAVRDARLAIEAGDDNLVAALTAPMRIAESEALRVHVTLTGRLESWQQRLRVALAPLGGLATLGRYQLAGAANVSGDATIGRQAWELSDVNVRVDDLRVDGAGVAVREPRVELVGDLVWNPNERALASRGGQLVASTIALRAQDVRARLAGDGPTASGRVAVRADLARLAAWFPSTPRPIPTGQVTGMVSLSHEGDELHALVDGAGRHVSVTSHDGQKVLWREPELKLLADVAYSADDGRVTIDSADLTSQTLRVHAAGARQGGVDELTGTADYDLAAWAPVIAGYLGPEVRLAGRHRATFRVTRVAPTAGGPAPHWSQTVRARVEAPWTSINIFGLPVGAGRLGLTLAKGRVECDPLSLAVSGGRVQLQAAARLDPPPAAWGATPGQVVTDVSVTPEVSERMLKYIAPVLAGATRCQGVFSLRLEAAGGPLAELANADATGQLEAKSVSVTPGPTTEQWVRVVRQVEALAKNRDPAALLGGASTSPTTLLSISGRTINFRVAEGRVYHEGLEFLVGDATVRSSGSVGFDESLALVLTVPIQDKWIEGERLLVGLRGQSVRIPVTGTFSRPRVDERALADLSGQMIRGGVQGAIGGEINRALEKLFGN